MYKTESSSNKPLVILKTSFSVSFICAFALGIIVSLLQGHSFDQFLYLTYVFFVNNLLMPISLAAVIYYYIDKDHRLGYGIYGRVKAVLFLAVVSMLLLLIWNVLDFLIHSDPHASFTIDRVLNDLQNSAMLGALMGLPVSFLVVVIYGFVDSKA